MKRVFCILLMLCLLPLSAMAEAENPFGPYALTLPEGVQMEEAEGTYACVSGTARVVVMYISRVPDEDAASAVTRLMAQFDPDAVLGEDIDLAPGVVGVQAVGGDRFGEGVDQLTVMILAESGDLLILSGYDLNGEEAGVQALLDALVEGMLCEGQKVVQPEIGA